MMSGIFDEFDDDEFLEFEHVAEKLSNRADLHAFILLDKLLPSERDIDIIGGADHDEIYLSIEPEELLKVATKDQLLDLHRCGVRDNNGLCMFV
jgi:flagellar motor switch protein FliG